MVAHVYLNGERIVMRNLPLGGAYYYFDDHLRSARVEQMPVGVLLNDKTALYGAACFALER